jgi:type I restriction enzyme S subunit
METTTTAEKIREHSLKKGDILFTPSSETAEDIGVSAVVTADLHNTVYSYHLIRLRTSNTLDLRFKKYFCNHYNVLSQFSKVCKGTTRQILGRDDFKDIVVVLPAEKEQRAIANYLDRKTAQVDDLIAKKEQMIKLLKEERIAIINQAVTKGIDPMAEVEDSGIEWLGKVPKHWLLKKIKYITRVNAQALSEATEDNYEFNYIDIGNVDLEEGFILGEKIRFANAPSRARRIVAKGDTVESTVRTYLKAIANFEESVQDIIVSTGFAVMHPLGLIHSRYLYYVLRSEVFIDRVCAMSVGVSYPAINASELASIPVWFPPNRKEQENIAEYLDQIAAKTKTAIYVLLREIELLKEYRTSLIFEVVTGKVCLLG